MSLQTLLLAAVIAGYGAIQYTLMIHAMRDLIHRSRVRGGNKVAWGLVILCVPIAGALIYGWMGPTSFLHRPARTPFPTESLPRTASDRPLIPSSKVTPIRPARPATSSHMRRRGPYHGAPAHSRPVSEPTHIRRTGS
jgi:hypothetical protein